MPENKNTALARTSEFSPEEVAAMIPVSLESLLSPAHEDSAGPEGAKSSVPYVGFRGKKAEKNLEALDAAGIKIEKDGSGKFYLMDSGEPLLVQPMGFHVIQYARFFTLTEEGSGKVIAASLTNDDGLFEDGYREHLYAAVAVARGEGQFTAATLQLQSGQCNALRQTIQLLGEPGRPGPACNPTEWGKRGAAHAKSAAAKVPGGRFRTEIWSVLTPPKSGKGQSYNEGHGRTYPTPEAEVAAFNEWCQKSWPRIQAVIAKYNVMVERTKRLALNAPATAKTTGDPIPF